jgi:two-component system, sensor histidine kinase and response regulator
VSGTATAFRRASRSDTPALVNPMASLRVLLAEDNIVNQRLAMALLGRRDAAIVVANNGREAVDRWSEGPFDLILMDIQMPEMDGLEATRVIRSREQPDHRVPIVALTARAMTGDREECLAAGMDAYLSKPIRAAELMELIDRVTGCSHAQEIEAKAQAAGTFDVDKLRSIVSGDDALVAELIALFAAEAPRYVDAICQAHAVRDRQGLRDAAHTLKGSANSITAIAVGSAAERIEIASRTAPLEHIVPAIADLQKALAELESEFQSLGLLARAAA